MANEYETEAYVGLINTDGGLADRAASAHLQEGLVIAGASGEEAEFIEENLRNSHGNTMSPEEKRSLPPVIAESLLSRIIRG